MRTPKSSPVLPSALTPEAPHILAKELLAKIRNHFSQRNVDGVSRPAR